MMVIVALLCACSEQVEDPLSASAQLPDTFSTTTSEGPPPVEALVAELRKFLPEGWDIVETNHGQVEPVRWLKGPGWHIRLKRVTDAPEEYWKSGRAGTVQLWIMERGYAPKHDKYAGMRAGSGPNVGPAREVGYWHGRRVLIWGGASDWENWESDVLFALDSTAQHPATGDVQENDRDEHR